MSISDVLIGYLWVVLAYQALDFAWTLVRRKAKPDPWRCNDFSEVKAWLATLLRRGYAGGHALFATDNADQSLKFRKYIREKTVYGLELCVPGGERAAAYWPKLQAYCEETGLRHRKEVEDSHGASGDVFLIDCERDVDRAYDLGLTIWTKIFKLSPDNWYDRKIHDISVEDQLIDSPDHPNPWPEGAEGPSLDTMDQLLRQTTTVSLGEAARYVVFMLLAHISLIGLPIATLLSAGDPPDWSIALGELTLGGSTASLAFFLLLGFAYLMLRGFINDKTEFKKLLASGPRTRLFWPQWRFIAITLPIAVILIWAGA